MKDLARIRIKAGDGGDGAVHFRREKYVPKGGPDGGDGGDGGSVFLVGDSNVETLIDFSFKREYEAKDGERGMGQKKHGKSRDDLRIKIPVGTVVYEIPSNYFQSSIKTREGFDQLIEKREEIVEILEDGQEYLIAEGGKGGLGNFHFRSSANRTPKEFEEGDKGDEKFLLLELKVRADVGIVGLPNVGKSSLLKVLTRANPKIGEYPFTTLEPNLGVLRIGSEKDYRSLTLVDVPGVVEEAWEGKGIGPWFMRHLERVKLIIHVLAPDPARGDDYAKQMIEDYRVVREEMKKYDSAGSSQGSQGLIEKQEIVVVNKKELLGENAEDIVNKINLEIGVEVEAVSVASSDIEGLLGKLRKFVN